MLPSVTSYLAAVTAPTIKQQNRARPLKTAAAAWTTKPVSTRCAATGRTSWRGRAKWIQHPQDTQSRPQNGTANYRGCHTRPKRWVQAIWVQGTQKRLGYIHRRPAIAQETCCCTRMQALYTRSVVYTTTRAATPWLTQKLQDIAATTKSFWRL
jgi:hypothetical protein